MVVGILLARPAAGSPPVVVRATRVASAPRLDGRLDESIWRDAAPLGPFVQRAPAPGAKPTQRSEARVLYGPSALYVGVRLWDTQPHALLHGLGRRDSPPPSDSVTIYLDPLGSARRAYYFSVNVSGVLSDGLVYNQSDQDGSWDGVWDARAQVLPDGWSAELEIPLTSLAYQNRDEQSWGILIERSLQRVRERSSWPATPKWGNAFVSTFARLEGLRGLRREHSVRLQPYALTELRLARRSDALLSDNVFVPNAGIDLRFTSRANVQLVASVNPDFGEVEVDPAVVVLTPDEAFFSERRPFFIEGVGIFRSPAPAAYSNVLIERPPPTLLYTRRIGRKPDAPEPSTGAEVVELDPVRQIAGALKLLGEGGTRLSYGAISALQLPTDAIERFADGRRARRRVTPWTHFGVLRGQLRLGARSAVGTMLTGASRFDEVDETDAYVGALDFDLQSPAGWQAEGFVSASSSQLGAGYGAFLRAGQLGDTPWRLWLELESYSPRYEINDLGFLWRNNMVQLRASAERYLAAPWGIFQEWSASFKAVYAFVHDDPSISFERLVELGNYGILVNRWEYWSGALTTFPRLDDRETRGGPPLPRDQNVQFWLGGNTDASRSLVQEAQIVVAAERSALLWHLTSNSTAMFWRRLRAVLSVGYRGIRDYPFWVDTVDSGSAPRVVIGDLSFDQLDVGLSATLGLRRDLTVQLLAQLLYATGHYPRYRELLTRPGGAVRLVPSSYAGDADFRRLTLIANAIVRWDLSAGTAAYLVYKLDGALAEEGQRGFALGDDLSHLLERRQTHRLLVKLSYAWDI